MWADAVTGRVELSPAALAAIPPMYAAEAVRAVLDGRFARPNGDPASVARGKRIFSERRVGTIVNRQILKRPPRAYAAAKLDGPMLAPIDATKSLDARLEVRCADCHAGAPLERLRLFAENPPPTGRCSHCHLAHPRIEGWHGEQLAAGVDSVDPGLVAIARAAPGSGPTPENEVGFCRRCHDEHRDFGPVVYSSSLLLPFDADGDGDAQLHPEADRRAGGIGTEPWLAFDVPRGEWPFSIEVAVIANPARAGKVGRTRIGVSWVRPAPLVGLAASAPYLHNGSVPTLAALLEPAARRPRSFALGNAGFVLDTRLPGNRNQGHEFGTVLTPAEKRDLIAFLMTL